VKDIVLWVAEDVETMFIKAIIVVKHEEKWLRYQENGNRLNWRVQDCQYAEMALLENSGTRRIPLAECKANTDRDGNE
jgi:hypothetical protein